MALQQIDLEAEMMKRRVARVMSNLRDELRFNAPQGRDEILVERLVIHLLAEMRDMIDEKLKYTHLKDI